MSRYFVSTAAFIAVLAATLHAQDAQPAPAINQADTAWMLVSTALVLLMTPALAFFYGGLVRSKNALNTMMMSFIAARRRRHRLGARRLLAGVRHRRAVRRRPVAPLPEAASASRPQGTIPHVLFMAYQGTFAIITAALISGAIVERMRFGAYLALHHALVDRRLRADRALGVGRRLAGQAGRARLRGRHRRARERRRRGARRGAGRRAAQGLRAPGDPAAQRAVRAARRGPALVRLVRLQRRQRARRRARRAALAFTTTMLAPIGDAGRLDAARPDAQREGHRRRRRDRDRRRPRRDHAGGRLRQPDERASCSARIAAFPSYFALLWRARTRLDDSLDVVAAHGVGGTVGALLTGVFAREGVERRDRRPARSATRRSSGIQAVAVLASIVYSGVGSVRPAEAGQRGHPAARRRSAKKASGMDVTQHGEEAYAEGEGAILVLPDRDVKVGSAAHGR